MLCKTGWSWELRSWSHKMNLHDILSTSPDYFCRKWIGATNENSNFDLRVQRVKGDTWSKWSLWVSWPYCPFYRPKLNSIYSEWRKSRVWCDSRLISTNRKSAFNLQQPCLLHDRFERGRWNAQHIFSFSTRFSAMLQTKLHVFVAHFKAPLMPEAGYNFRVTRTWVNTGELYDLATMISTFQHFPG